MSNHDLLQASDLLSSFSDSVPTLYHRPNLLKPFVACNVSLPGSLHLVSLTLLVLHLGVEVLSGFIALRKVVES